MNRKVIISRSKPNYISIAVSLMMFYYSYNHFVKNNMVMAIVALAVGLLGLVHTVLLLSTPLLIQEKDALVVKPKIPFERKVLLTDEITEVKALSDSILLIITEGKLKIKLDMGGFKEKEITEARRYIQSLVKG
ncbi:MAG: hypothetical protein HYZ14_03400 [Bacteroidetes bacterium]|nr:hypothetical protein [Bacteroidota bacterium]